MKILHGYNGVCRGEINEIRAYLKINYLFVFTTVGIMGSLFTIINLSVHSYIYIQCLLKYIKRKTFSDNASEKTKTLENAYNYFRKRVKTYFAYIQYNLSHQTVSETMPTDALSDFKKTYSSKKAELNA